MCAIGASQWQFGSPDGMCMYFTGYQMGADGHRFGYGSCKPFRDRMATGLAFAIMACGALAINFASCMIVVLSSFLSSLQEYGGPLRLVSLGCSVFSFACLLIAWPITESTRTKDLCGLGSSLGSHFGIARGLALLIAAWVLGVVEIILAIVGLVRQHTAARV